MSRSKKVKGGCPHLNHGNFCFVLFMPCSHLGSHEGCTIFKSRDTRGKA